MKVSGNLSALTLLICLTCLSSCKNGPQSEHVNTRADSTQASIPVAQIDTTFVVPESVGYVNDFSGLLNEEQILDLENIIHVYDSISSNQIAIVTVDSIPHWMTLGEYTRRVGNAWGVGQAEKNNGLVIAFCKPARKIWLGTGTGIQDVLTPEALQQVINEQMIPQLKNGEDYIALKYGLEECINLWQ